MKPKLFSAWRYVGPGDGRFERHKVVWLGMNVITWSDLESNASGGWSWMGGVKDFLEQFRPL